MVRGRSEAVSRGQKKHSRLGQEEVQQEVRAGAVTKLHFYLEAERSVKKS